MLATRALSPYIQLARRDRRGTLLLIALVTGVTAAALVTAVLGAVRSPGAFDRLRDATRASDVYRFLVGPPSGSRGDEALSTARSVEGAIAADIQAELFVSPSFERYFPNFSLSDRHTRSDAHAHHAATFAGTTLRSTTWSRIGHSTVRVSRTVSAARPPRSWASHGVTPSA